MNSMLKLTSFVEVMDGRTTSIDLVVNEKLKQQVDLNRQVLKSILKCIEFCGRQGVALQGHDDSHDISVGGNFNGLLNKCIDADEVVLKNQIDTCAKNAKYTSKTAQKELLLYVKEYIQKKIKK